MYIRRRQGKDNDAENSLFWVYETCVAIERGQKWTPRHSSRYSRHFYWYIFVIESNWKKNHDNFTDWLDLFTSLIPDWSIRNSGKSQNMQLNLVLNLICVNLATFMYATDLNLSLIYSYSYSCSLINFQWPVIINVSNVHGINENVFHTDTA